MYIYIYNMYIYIICIYIYIYKYSTFWLISVIHAPCICSPWSKKRSTITILATTPLADSRCLPVRGALQRSPRQVLGSALGQ